MPSIKAIAFFAYPVSDMTEARAFYEQVLGLKLTLDHEGKWVEYDIGDSTLAITTMLEERTPGAAGGFVALEVENLDDWVADLKAKKITFIVEPFETPVCRLFVIADPDGNEVTLHQRKAT
jgi:predicted enzyme related to lactoylglutathione lyase